MDLVLHLMIMTTVYIIFALSLNVELGYTGLFNFGHVAFFAIGAYTSALFSLGGLPFAAGLLSGMIAAGIGGFILSIPALKLRGDYFGIATLGFGEIIRLLFQNEVWLTKGPMGIPAIPRPALFSYRFESLDQYLVLYAGFAVLTFIILSRVVKSPFGRALKAIRDDETAAEILGKNTFVFRIKSLVIGSVFAGLAGALWAHYTTFISPGDFTILETILVLLMIVLGGKGTMTGPVAGAVVLVFFQESLRFLHLPPEWSRYVAPLQQMIFGALLVALMILRPDGLVREKGKETRD